MTTFVTRKQWGARSPRNISRRTMSAKSTGHWNGPTVKVGGKTSWDHSKCASLVRGIQRFHMDSRGWADIAYNFVVCPHDCIFEGRGLNVANGANGTNHGNRTSHAVMWLTGQGNPFTDGEKRGFKYCVRHIADRTAAPNAAIGHRDHKSTECPGDARYNWIRGGMPLSNVNVPKPPDMKPIFGLPTLKYESRGDHVKLVQHVLKQHTGADVDPTGYFDCRTVEAVMNLQKFFKLTDTPDGVVGPKTWGVIAWLSNR